MPNSEIDSKYPWRYRCSICDGLIRAEDARAHLDEEKAKSDWPGVMHLSRVDESKEHYFGTVFAFLLKGRS